MSGKHTPGPTERVWLDGSCDCEASSDGTDVSLCPLHASAPELLAMLEETQWDATDYFDCQYCTACDGEKNDGHARDCTRAALIAKAKGEQL